MSLPGLEDLPRGPLHIALGVFDGVHLGHREVARRLVAGARSAGATAVAVTFDPLPIQVLAPGAPPSALSDAAERAALLREVGADAVAALRFDATVAALGPEEFLGLLCATRTVRRIVVGGDFRFGRDRSGDVRLLGSWGASREVDLEVVPALVLDGEVVSSTRIRNLLHEGDVAAAARLLGRPYPVPGVVVAGEQRGRGLGYPTVNLDTPPERLLPADGIYAMWVDVDGRRLAAAASLGIRPTFGGGPRRLEAHLLDFSGDLYGAALRASFVLRLRGERSFHDAAALTAQIDDDVRRTRTALGVPGTGNMEPNRDP